MNRFENKMQVITKEMFDIEMEEVIKDELDSVTFLDKEEITIMLYKKDVTIEKQNEITEKFKKFKNNVQGINLSPELKIKLVFWDNQYRELVEVMNKKVGLLPQSSSGNNICDIHIRGK